MEELTLGQISNWINFIAGIFGSSCIIVPVVMKFAKRIINSNLENGLKPIQENIVHINKVAEGRLQSYEAGMRCLLRNDILYVYMKCCKDGRRITMQEKQSINYSFEIYKQMGGNSFVADIVEEMNEFELIN